MHTFVVVGAKPGRVVPESVLAVLRSEHPAELTFAPDAHLHWSDRSGDLHLAGWQARADNLGVISRWEVRPTGVTAFSGLVWLRARGWAPGTSWAAQLADACAREPLDRLTSDLDGVFAAASLATDGHGTVTADPLGVAELYIADTADVTVVGTRAALVARVAAGTGGTVARDVEGAGWVAYCSNLHADRTTFAGVEVVPQGSSVRFGPGAGATVDTWSRTPWLDGPTLDGDALSDAIDASAGHMRSLVRLFTSLPASMVTLELTGGRDSRLVLALLLAEHLEHEVVAMTWGRPDLPDVVVATEIADRFGLAHRASTRRPQTGPGRPGPDPTPASTSASAPTPPLDPAARYDADIRFHVWRTSGAISLWDLGAGADRPSSPAVAVTGQFGEVLRTNFHGTDRLDRDDVAAYVEQGLLGFDAAGLLRPDARRHYDERIVQQLEALRPPGGSAHDAIDGLNLVDRLRRWNGTALEDDHRNRVFPLYSMPAVRTAFGMGSTRRRRELLPFELVRRCSDDLARMPFAGSPWPAGVADHLDDPTGYPTAPPPQPWRPPPRPSTSSAARWWGAVRRGPTTRRRPVRTTTAAEASRMRDIAHRIPVLHGMVDLDRNHPAFDIVDRGAVHRAIDQLPDLPFLARRAVHDAVTTAVWLSEAESPTHPSASASR